LVLAPAHANEAIVVAHLDDYESLLAVLGSRVAANVIQRIADRLALVARDAQVYRTGERQLSFALSTADEIEMTLDGLRPILLRPVEAGGRGVDVTIALGLATEAVTGRERQQIDAALAAEQALDDGLFWCRANADDAALERSITLMSELDVALDAGQIDVFYQPKFDLRANRITSAEALVRWPHRERGFIPPDVFISLAERTNRIEAFTLYVLQRVISDQAAWRGDHDVSAAVNISAKLLSTSTFNAKVQDILMRAQVPANALTFEVTESAALSIARWASPSRSTIMAPASRP
jgi:predicted signal transduction protein with EAL and GGDEF domain